VEGRGMMHVYTLPILSGQRSAVVNIFDELQFSAAARKHKS
jgi:hypothetical protein